MAIAARAAYFENGAEWDDVWDEFDARGGAAPAGRPKHRSRKGRAIGSSVTAEDGTSPPRHRPRILRAVVGAAVAVAVLAGLWAAVPYALAARMTATLRSGDAAALSRQMDPAGANAGLRDALRAEVPDWLTGGARRYVETMAERMAAAAEARGGAARVVGLRAALRDGEALPRPEVLRTATPIGATAFRLDYGPERGPGGLSFDVAWQGTEFRVVAMRVMDPPARPMPATVIALR